eukprot:781536-Pyramimonas_sp.AAC.1
MDCATSDRGRTRFPQRCSSPSPRRPHSPRRGSQCCAKAEEEQVFWGRWHPGGVLEGCMHAGCFGSRAG